MDDNIYNIFTNLESNTRVVYTLSFFVFSAILFHIFNFNSQFMYSLIISGLIFYIIFQNKTNSINTDVKQINRINRLLNLKNYKFIANDLAIGSIYLDLINFRKLDKYNYLQSMSELDKFLEIYQDLKLGNNDYGQLLDIAQEKKDNTLNYLVSISYSITANLGYNPNKTIVQNPEQKKLLDNVDNLKTILDKYWFEMLDMARSKYETEEVSTNSRPINYDKNDPKPIKTEYFSNAFQSNFEIFNGVVEP